MYIVTEYDIKTLRFDLNELIIKQSDIIENKYLPSHNFQNTSEKYIVQELFLCRPKHFIIELSNDLHVIMPVWMLFMNVCSDMFADNVLDKYRLIVYMQFTLN
jgi:hypothetical protein